MKDNFNMSKLLRSNVARLDPYRSARDEFKGGNEPMVFLDANENPYPNGVNRYPDPYQQDLKEVLSRLKDVHTSKILLGNGSDEVLDLLFRAFCEPGIDNIITVPPSYGMYKVQAGINDIENREVFLSPNFELRVQEIVGAQDERSKLLFLCSPNNPTGNSFSEECILQLLNAFNGLVVIDEAYIDFSEKESWLKRLDQLPNLVIVQTLSKAYGLAGIRLGMCYASEAIIAVLHKIKPPYNVNELTQQRAMDRLLKTDEVNNEISCLLDAKEILYKQLLDIYFVSHVYTSDANFILIKVDDASKRYEQLIKAGVVVRDRSSQPLCENTLRITVGTKTENEHLIAVLKTLYHEKESTIYRSRRDYY
ncbi:histidinol-phosphate transaminase [Altibacter sp.]|uniref:histidinol-phosphate transaminase n=1 Tax=Altibacter sp. TaxID=2024823 RepID=UPI00258AF90C|nr:histidinol-phosphate transaminase [Altibacter sp.]MCW9037778.1 histidinol-phosphate transaminase [Altibacter sp.]